MTVVSIPTPLDRWHEIVGDGPPPAALPTADVATLLGAARGTVWAMARDEGGIVDTDGNIVVRPFYLGRALRWPAAPLLELLGLAEPSGAALAVEPNPGRAGVRLVCESGAAEAYGHAPPPDHEGRAERSPGGRHGERTAEVRQPGRGSA